MSFIHDDEYFILMDMPLASGRWLTLEELKQLRDVGVQTAYMYGTRMDLQRAYIDPNLERYRQAGMKCLLPLWNRQSSNVPASYFVKTQQGVTPGVWSPWNPEAMNNYNSILQKMKDEYTADDCQVISCWLTDGETVLLNEPAYFDEWALKEFYQRVPNTDPLRNIWEKPEGAQWLRETYTRLLVEQQRILVDTPWREIWFALHRQIATYPELRCHGCDYIDDYLHAFWELKPNAVNHISFTYFPHGPVYWNKVKLDHIKYGVEEWAGAEYAEGLRAGNGRLAVEQGLRGMYIGPTHPFTGHAGIEPWMLQEIRKTTELFRERV